MVQGPFQPVLSIQEGGLNLHLPRNVPSIALLILNTSSSMAVNSFVDKGPEELNVLTSRPDEECLNAVVFGIALGFGLLSAILNSSFDLVKRLLGGLLGNLKHILCNNIPERGL